MKSKGTGKRRPMGILLPWPMFVAVEAHDGEVPILKDKVDYLWHDCPAPKWGAGNDAADLDI